MRRQSASHQRPPAVASRTPTKARYAIEGGSGGKARLDVLSSVLRQGTISLLLRAGVMPGDRCVDVGCGARTSAGNSRELSGRAERSSESTFDVEILELANRDAENEGLEYVRFLVGDATSIPGGPYDLAYTRFLLSHVHDPTAVLSAMVASLARGGVVIAEDTDFSGNFWYPDSPTPRRFALDCQSSTEGLIRSSLFIAPLRLRQSRNTPTQSHQIEQSLRAARVDQLALRR